MISTKNLKVSYGDTVVIKELNLTLPKGKVTALVGLMDAVSQLC